MHVVQDYSVAPRSNPDDSEKKGSEQEKSGRSKSILVPVTTIIRSARAYTGILTNAISSIGNFAISITLARTLGITDLGEFGIAFAIYAFITGLSRAIICEPLLASHPSREDFSAGSNRASLIGAATGVVVLLVSISISSPYLFAISFAMHGLVIFDYLKSMNLAIFNKKHSLVQDSTWTISAVIAAALVYLEWITGFQGFILWAWSGAIIGYFSMYLHSMALQPKWNIGRAETKNSLAFGGDFVIGSGASQVSFNLVGVVAGLSTVGSLRAAATLLGPISIIVGSARTLAIPYLSRGISHGYKGILTRAIASTSIIGFISVPVLTFIAFIPSHLGELLLGQNWGYAEPILPFLALEMLSIALTSIPFAGFRALKAGKSTIIIRSILALFRITVVVLSANFGGLIWAAIAMAITSLVGTAVWWTGYIIQLRRKLKE